MSFNNKEFIETIYYMEKLKMLHITDFKKGIFKFTDEYFNKLTEEVRNIRKERPNPIEDTKCEEYQSYEDRIWHDAARTSVRKFIPKIYTEFGLEKISLLVDLRIIQTKLSFGIDKAIKNEGDGLEDLK